MAALHNGALAYLRTKEILAGLGEMYTADALYGKSGCKRRGHRAVHARRHCSVLRSVIREKALPRRKNAARQGLFCFARTG